MTFHLITIFPQIFDSYFNESILKRARDEGHIEIKVYDLRDWATDKHRTVDDTPYGGGAGMVMKVEPIYKAIKHIARSTQHAARSKESEGRKQKSNPTPYPLPPKTLLTSAKGKTWNQALAQEYTKLSDLIIVCGRYEGVDERVTSFVDEEISIGDYILTGGEIPAQAMVDSITRLLPGVLGNPASLDEESHNQIANRQSPIANPKEYPQYTKPEIFTDDEGHEHRVPEILLSGHHAEIKKWREEQMTDHRVLINFQ